MLLVSSEDHDQLQLLRSILRTTDVSCYLEEYSKCRQQALAILACKIWPCVTRRHGSAVSRERVSIDRAVCIMNRGSLTFMVAIIVKFIMKFVFVRARTRPPLLM